MSVRRTWAFCFLTLPFAGCVEGSDLAQAVRRGPRHEARAAAPAGAVARRAGFDAAVADAARDSAAPPPELAPDAALPRAGSSSARPAHDEVDAASPVRTLFSGELVNARDLGGTPLASGASVAYEALFRGPPLAAFSERGCSQFEQSGIRTVIDLRVASEVASRPESACVTQGARIVQAPLPVPYQVSASDYIAILNASDSIAAVFRELGDARAYPVYFHCTWGRDRTGVLAALILAALGAERAAIMEEYNLSLANVGAYPLSLMAALDEVERRGGIRAYLTEVGVSDEQLRVLRSRAVLRDR